MKIGVFVPRSAVTPKKDEGLLAERDLDTEIYDELYDLG